MTAYNGARHYPLIQLHDLEDVEEVCTKAARRFCADNYQGLPEADFEWLVATLVWWVWREAPLHDPKLSPSFAGFIRGNIKWRCIDWFRGYAGRTRWQFADRVHERAERRTVSLDAPAGADGGALEDAVAAVGGDPAAGAGADLFGGLLHNGGSEAPFDTAVVRALARRLLRARSAAARAERAA